MTEPIGDPTIVVRRAASAPGGQVDMTDEAVQTWIKGYRDYADTMRGIADEIRDYRKDTFFGDLDSLRQLAAGYDQLLMGGEGSLYQRVLEFAQGAEDIANKLSADWCEILEQDGQTEAALRLSQ